MTAPEVPDWTRPVSVMGKDSEGNPVTVLLDSLGRLICVLYGAITLSGPIDVTQVDSTREIQGADGVTLHTIAVDAAGHIIMVPYGTLTVDGAVDVTQTDSAREIQGSDGSTLYTIAVDNQGRIISIIKGMYGTEMKDVAVDEQGRMIMIPTDPLDIWGNAISMGNAELAAVLSLANRLDRRGDVFFTEDFKDGMAKWLTTVSGSGASVSLSSTYALYGGFSAKLTSGSTLSRLACIYHEQYYPSATKLGLEFCVAIGGSLETVTWFIEIYTGARYIYSGVRYNHYTSKLEYQDSSGVWQTLSSPVIVYAGDGLFHGGKLVIDPVTEKYVRFLFGKNEYDMSALSFHGEDDNTAPFISVQAYVNSLTGANTTAYVDSVVLTQNEPPNVE